MVGAFENFSANPATFTMQRLQEQNFLLLAVKNICFEDTVDEGHERLAELCSEGLDWLYIQKQAHAHRIGSLIHEFCVSQNEEVPIPPDIRQYFQDMYQQTYLQNSLIYRQFDLILQKFEQRKIVPVLLKGIMFAKWAYPGIALRPMRDIDLLLEKRDIPAAIKVMRTLGYSNILKHLTYLSAWHQRHEERLFSALKHEGYHLPTFIKNVGIVNVCVELHHHLTPLMKTEHVRSVALAGSEFTIRALQPEYFLLHLCFHLYHHSHKNSLPRLIWYCDIAMYLKSLDTQIDWESFHSLCRQFQVEEEVRHTLLEAQSLFTFPLPTELFSAGHNVRCHLNTLFPEQEPNQEQLFLHALFRHKKSEFGRYLWENLFPSREFLIHRYAIRHRWQVPLYYPLRLIKACIRGTRFGIFLLRQKIAALLTIS